MDATQDIATWIGQTLVTEGGDRVGVVDGIFLDEDTSDPEWVAVTLDADSQDRLVPIIAITPDGDRLRVTFAADVIASAPIVDLSVDINPDEEQQLYGHYGNIRSGDSAQEVSTRTYRKLGH